MSNRPKPSALKLVEGNPGHRPINKREPKPTGIPACPAQLDQTAKNEWRRISRSLITMGLLTVVDRSALAAYCSAFSSWMTAEEKIQKFGHLIKTAKSGYPMQNPYVAIKNTSMDQMRKFLIEFGMTPASRSRISVGDNGEVTDPFETFMKGIGAPEV